MTDDKRARIIAAAWHGGMMTAMYALCSTGATELRKGDWPRLLDEIENDGSLPELEWLRAYVTKIGARGPVAGWSEIHWTPEDERKVFADGT